MMVDRLREYLDQMRTAARQACDFVTGVEREEFLSDIRTQMAVNMALVLIGEAASRIMTRYPDFTVDHPEIPWSQIRGMRNFVAHDYYELELPIVWETAKVHLPVLLGNLETLRHRYPQGE